MQCFRLAHAALLIAILAAVGSAVAASPETLAIVGGDTLTTIDLRIELNIMEKRGGGRQDWDFPEPDAVLRRLIQNRLIVQEGYRMGLDQDFAVRNQVSEAVNSRCMGALLDSVALAVPTDTPDLREARRLAVKGYIQGLIEKYEVQVDSTLLRSLDYGSREPEMQERLRDSQEVLAKAPTGNLSVSAFTRIVRFTAFHGLEGKPDAEERRDRIFHEWVAEAVTIHEVRQRGFAQRPEIRTYAERLERSLMLEETLKILLDFSFDPQEEQIEAYYQEHIDQFLAPAQVRMESLKFMTEEAAAAAREQLAQGAKLSWIKRNAKQVIEGPAPFPDEFFEVGKLNLKPEEAVKGFIPQPYGVPGGWVLARVTDVREPVPVPLPECRDRVLGLMGSEATSRHMKNIIGQLEAAVPVTIEPGAEEIVGRALKAMESGQEAE